MLIKSTALIALMLLTSAPAAAGNKVKKHNDVSSHSLSVSTPSIDFESFSPGDFVSDIGNGVAVAVFKHVKNGTMVGGNAVIFDSSSPTGEDFYFGTPNESFGGPGIGRGGEAGQLFANSEAHGNVLVIAESKGELDDNALRRGTLIFTFEPPRAVSSVGLLNSEETATFEIATNDGGMSMVRHENLGDNSFRSVAIGKPQVAQIVITLDGSAAITDIVFRDPGCTTFRAVNFNDYVAGDAVISLNNGITVNALKRTTKKKKTSFFPAKAMIYNSTAPSGQDADLGTPHFSFGGQGCGNAGKKGMLFENAVAKENVLVIGKDDDSSDHDDNAHLLIFDFAMPMTLDSIGLLDNENATAFEIFNSAGGKIIIVNCNGGNNSFELVSLGALPQVTKVRVTLLGSGAITEFNACTA